jgi:hypothetical protein
MPFAHLQGHNRFAPTVLEAMRKAYEDAFAELQLTADNPMAAALAAEIISLASAGERASDQLKLRAITALAKAKFKRFRPKSG